jgi:hypothetical protein
MVDRECLPVALAKLKQTVGRMGLTRHGEREASGHWQQSNPLHDILAVRGGVLPYSVTHRAFTEMAGLL